MSFTKNRSKNVNRKYSQKPFDSIKKSAIDALKTALKSACLKTTEKKKKRCELTGKKI